LCKIDLIRIPRTAGLLLLIALSLRLAWACALVPPENQLNRLPDQAEYLSLGRELLQSGSMSFIDPRFHQRVYAYRSPGYPLLVAACGGRVLLIRLVQALLDTSAVLAVYLLAQRLTRRTAVALLAGAVAALNPFLIYFSGLVLSETLFTALLAWGTCLLAFDRIAAAALLLAGAAAVRPEAIVLGPLLAFAAAGLNRPAARTYHWKRALRDGAIVAAAITLALLPWAWRNHRVLGAWIWTTTNSGVTLYDGFNPAATGASDQRFLAAMPQLGPITEVERSRRLRQMAAQWARDNVGRLPGLTLAKIARTWSPVPLSEEFGRPLYRLVAAAYALPLDVLVIVGLLRRGTLTRQAKLLLCMAAVWLTVVHGLTVGSMRYRLAAEPALAVAAASGAARKSER
jgi:4-amino-4-deoxy-L-arabinose transferase-like glycosyltransferase